MIAIIRQCSRRFQLAAELFIHVVPMKTFLQDFLENREEIFSASTASCTVIVN